MKNKQMLSLLLAGCMTAAPVVPVYATTSGAESAEALMQESEEILDMQEAPVQESEEDLNMQEFRLRNPKLTSRTIHLFTKKPAKLSFRNSWKRKPWKIPWLLSAPTRFKISFPAYTRIF